jgi:hypothetical protein
MIPVSLPTIALQLGHARVRVPLRQVKRGCQGSNEFISLFVGDADAPPRRADQWQIETESSAGAGRFGLFHGAHDPGKDELSCGAALSRSGLMDAAVKVARQVDRGPDRIGLNTHRLCADDLNKSFARKTGQTAPCLTLGVHYSHRVVPAFSRGLGVSRGYIADMCFADGGFHWGQSRLGHEFPNLL